MKEITNDFLKEVTEDYLSKDIYTIARGALSNSDVTKLVENKGEYNKTRPMFSIEIQTLPVCNQKKSGRCWIFAGLNVLREIIGKKYNLEKFELSQSYIAFWDKLEKCNFLLETVMSLLEVDKDDRTLVHVLFNGIEDGGQWDMFVNIVNKYGVVPQDAFPETYQSSNSRDINRVLNRLIRKFAYDARHEFAGDMEPIRAKKEALMKDIYKALCSAYGVPPKSFTFETVNKDTYEYKRERNVTPHEFVRNFLEVDLNDYVSIINSPTDDKPFNSTFTVKHLGNVVEGNRVKYLNLEMPRFKELVISQLKDKEVVWFGSDCSKYGGRDVGLWDDKTYDTDTLFQVNSKMTKEAMLDSRESAMNHAMVITGVDLVDNKSTKWKIENSWGEDIAYEGYYVASDSWFDNYVYQAVVNKKYLSEAELAMLKQEPIELNPWDPMGTLAK